MLFLYGNSTWITRFFFSMDNVLYMQNSFLKKYENILVFHFSILNQWRLSKFSFKWDKNVLRLLGQYHGWWHCHEQGHQHVWYWLCLKKMAANFLTTFSNAFSLMKMYEFRLRFHIICSLKGPINNIPALVQIIGWCQPGDKPLSEPMMVSLLTHICVTRLQWVNPHVAETKIFLSPQVNATVADALAIQKARPSATMVSTTYDRQVLVFHKEGFQLPVSCQFWEMTENVYVNFYVS